LKTLITEYQLIFLAIGALSTFIGFYIYNYYQQKKSLHHCYKQWLRTFKEVIQSTNSEWMVFDPKAQNLTLSPNLSALLSLHKKPDSFPDFLSNFTHESLHNFEPRFKVLLKEKTPFKAQLVSKSHQDTFDVGVYAFPKSNQILFMFVRPHKEQENKMEDTNQIENLSKECNTLKFLLDSLPYPAWHRDKTGQLKYCNKSYAIAMDLQPEKILEQNRLVWGNSSYSSAKQSSVPTLVDSLKKYLVFDGERRLMEFFEQEDPHFGISGYAVDLTDLKKATSELERHTSSYREVLENLSAAIAIYGPDRRLKFFNHAYSRMFDMDENWLHTCPTLGEVLDDLRQRRTLPEHADYAAYKKNQLQMVTTILHPFQELIHLPDERTLRKITSPHPIGGIFYIYEDLTDSLVLERKHNTQLAVQKASLDNLYEGIAVFGIDSSLRLTNAAFRRLWELTPHQTKEGLHMSDVIESCKEFFDLSKDWAVRKEKLLSMATDRIPKKKQIFRQDGTVVDFSYMPLPDGSHLMSCIDITDSYRIEKILRERNETLETADHLKSEFIANVSSHLKEPLNSILSSVEILSNQYFGNLNSHQTDHCQSILSSSQKLLKFVNNILDLARIEAGHLPLKFKEVKIKEVLQNAVNLQTPYAEEKNIKIKLKHPRDIGTFNADEERLNQVLFNLLSIAIETSPEDEKITLFCEKTDQHLILKIENIYKNSKNGLEKEKAAAITPPLPENLNEKSPDFTLSLIKNLIKLHKGDISIEQSGETSAFKVTCYLPLALEKNEELEKTAHSH
jgi:signal transduction histidine kinase